MQLEEPITFCPPLLSKIWDLLNDKEREWLLSCMDLQQREDEAQQRAAEAQQRAAEAQQRAVEAQQRAVEAEQRAVEVEQRAVEAEQRVNTLTEEIEKLKKKTAKQSSRLGQNSTNSHKPPSSDGPEKKKKKRKSGSKRKKGNRKPGGQPGHTGNHRLVPLEEVTSVNEVIPPTCKGCNRNLSSDDTVGKPRIHQVFELPKVEMEVHQYNLHRCQCRDCGEYTLGELKPENRTGQGPNLTAFIGLCTAAFRLSRRVLQELLLAMTGRSPSVGAIQRCWERTAEAVAPAVEELEKALPFQPSLHLDETGWKEKGKKLWLWVATTTNFACFSINNRSRDQIKCWFPNGYSGVICSDRWNAYERFDRRQLCWAHLLRDIQAIIDGKGLGSMEAENMLNGAHQMFHHWHQYKDGNLSRSELKSHAQPFRDAFKHFCDAGKSQSKKDKNRDVKWSRLGKSLVNRWSHVFRFLDEEGIEPTNNHAERQVRPGVLWRKISHGTRSEAGSQAVSYMLSVVQTCKLQVKSALAFIKKALLAFWNGEQCPSLLFDSS